MQTVHMLPSCKSFYYYHPQVIDAFFNFDFLVVKS